MHSHDWGTHHVKCDSYRFTSFWDMAGNGQTDRQTDFGLIYINFLKDRKTLKTKRRVTSVRTSAGTPLAIRIAHSCCIRPANKHIGTHQLYLDMQKPTLTLQVRNSPTGIICQKHPFQTCQSIIYNDEAITENKKHPIMYWSKLKQTHWLSQNFGADTI